MKIETILIFKKRASRRADFLADKIASWATGKGIKTSLASGDAHGREKMADLLVVLGGDGTFLSAVRYLGGMEIPVMGVNLGALGFLTEIAVEEIFQALEGLIRDEGLVEKRMTLAGEIIRGGEVIERFTVLNDVVFSKGALARISELGVWVDGLFLTLYRADGLIISTPTGSTAYSLSAGGPIVHPALPAIVLSPICPHAMSHRPIILGPQSVVEVRLKEMNGEVVVTLDGQSGLALEQNDMVRVHRSASSVLLVRAPGRDYFSLLRTKLMWGDRLRTEGEN
ncbi:NAD(+) kinase [bacterium]|nr:MAG: NAD(+) kinase [bacterium]